LEIVRQRSCVRVSTCQNLNVISYGACARAPARMRRLRASARARARRRARTPGQARWCERRDNDVGDSGGVRLPARLYLSPLPSPPPLSPFPSRSHPLPCSCEFLASVCACMRVQLEIDRALRAGLRLVTTQNGSARRGGGGGVQRWGERSRSEWTRV
jgi:hypothetical protein